MKCKTPSCDNPAHSCGLCQTCYSYIHRAMRRGVRWMMARRTRITVWQERLDSIAAQDNVVHIKRRRA